MMHHTTSNTITRSTPWMRPGNAVILVSALLVLLVLIATVFLSRMRSMRQAGLATRVAMERDDAVEGVAEAVASEIAGNLFPRAIDYDLTIEFAGGQPPDQGRRKAAAADAVRYGRDSFFAWNHAPHATVPWTNPPDWATWPIKPGPLREMTIDGVSWSMADWMWPEEPHNDTGTNPLRLFPGYSDPSDITAGVVPERAIYDPAQNPLGDPGIADSRFLRDIEPQRVGARTRDYSGSFDADYDATRDLDFAGGRMANMFSHWRHMSYMPAAWNGWRVVRDIADVTGVRTALGPDGYPDGETAWADGRVYYGGLLNRLDVPIEQFPAVVPSRLGDRITGGFDVDGDGVLNGLADHDNGAAVFLAPDGVRARIDWDDPLHEYVSEFNWDHWDRMRSWMTPLGWRRAMELSKFGAGELLPVNFYRLEDLDGDGVTNEIGERSSDEFVKDTSRWHVGRTLADADGDGFTDSFWNLVPHDGNDGTRQIVAVSVTDNTGRLNVNTATRFFPYDRNNTSSRYNSESTRGHTPADLALVGQNRAPYGDNDDTFDPRDTATWNVGFFDYEGHQPIFQTASQENDGFSLLQPNWNRGWSPFLWDPWDSNSTIDALVGWKAERWQEPDDWTRSLLGNLGYRGNLGYPDGSAPLADVNDRDNRTYISQSSSGQWRSPQAVNTPFTLSDELELRAYEGNSMPWLISRLERATGDLSEGWGDGVHPLHGQFERAESVEGMDRLDNRQLTADLRHRLTTINGARNDVMPSHLWWENRAPMPDPRTLTLPGTAGGITPTTPEAMAQLYDDAAAQFREKIDLREWGQQVLRQDWLDFVGVDMLDQLGWFRRRSMEQRLPHSLMLALTGGYVTEREPVDPVTWLPTDINGDGRADPAQRHAYHGYDNEAWERTRRSAAALAQSIAARRMPRIIRPGTQDGVGTTFDMGPYPLYVQDPANLDAVNRAHQVSGAQPLPVFLPGSEPSFPFDPLTTVLASGQQLLGGLDQWNSWPQKVGDAPLINISPAAPNLIDDAIDLSDAGGSNAFVGTRRLEAMSTSGLGSLNNALWGPWEELDVPVDVTGDQIADLTVNRAAGDLYQSVWDPHIFVQRAEPQPVIGEIFVAHVGRPWMIPGDRGTSPETFGFPNSNEWLMLAAYGDDDREKLGNGTDGNGTDSPFMPPTDCDDLDDFIEPVAPHTVLAVQILNPFDVPIRLFDYNPLSQQWDLPRFSVKFLRENRYDPESEASYEIVLAPNSINRGAAYDATAPRIEPLSNGMHATATVGDRFTPGDLNTPWYLPPASEDRPYALTILLNGVEAMEGGLEEFDSTQAGWDAVNMIIDQDGQSQLASGQLNNLDAAIYAGAAPGGSGDGISDEAEAWIDFLDLLPSEQPFGDVISDPSGVYARAIGAGDMVWRVVADETLVDSNGDNILPMFASDWYDEDVEPAGGMFNGPSIDPSIGVGVELVRKVYQFADPDFDGIRQVADLLPVDGNADGGFSHQDAVDVVIDRTVGADGKDEFGVLLTDQMARFRLPSFGDLDSLSANFMPQPGDQQTGNGFPMRGKEGTGNGVGGTPDLRYPRVLSDWPSTLNQGESGLQDPDSNGFTSLPSVFRVDPYFARWTQWARYARPWSVDDFDEDVTDQADVFWPSPEQLGRLGRHLARPDRRGPRFAIGEGRVTASWTRDAAIGLNTMPAGGTTGGINESAQLSLRPAAYQVGSLGNAAVLAEDPILIDANLPPVDPIELARLLQAAGMTGGSIDILTQGDPDERDELVRVLRSRRYAEQSLRTAPNSDMPSGSVASLGRWYINDGDTSATNIEAREIGIGILDDPRYDAGMPSNSELLNGVVWNDNEYLVEDFTDGSVADEGWPLVYGRFNNTVPPNPFAEIDEGNPVRVGSTYHDALGWTHGRFFDWRWDPEGLGRYDFDGDGQVNDPATMADAHGWDQTGINGNIYGNPYGYPWMTRTARLPWRLRTNSTQPDVDATEYHGFRCDKPHAFGFGATFTSRGRDAEGNWRNGTREGGWGGAMTDTYGLPWSYADKGLYGFREIDGDVLEPNGIQLPSMHVHNFEQVGEALNEMAVGTELWMPIAASGANTSQFIWPAVTYNPQYTDGATPGLLETAYWPPRPAMPMPGFDAAGNTVPLARRTWPVTLRTLPEWLAKDGHAGRLSLHGEDDPFNVVVGAVPVETELLNGTDPAAWLVPDYVLDSDDPRYLDPGQPAAGRVADLFVCDGPGLYDLADNAAWIANGNASGVGDGFPDDERFGVTSYEAITGRDPSLGNAGTFGGQAVPGLVNINTAPMEVLRAMPHMTRLVHGSPDRIASSLAGVLDSPPAGNTARPMSRHPRSALSEAIVQYRDGAGVMAFKRWDDEASAVGRNTVLSPPFPWMNRDLVPGHAAGPSYRDRGARFYPDPWPPYEPYSFDRHYGDLGKDVIADHAVRATDGRRGFASIGQLFALRRPALMDFGLTDFNDDGVEDVDRREGIGSSVNADAWRMDFAARNPFGWQGEQVDGPFNADAPNTSSPYWDEHRQVFIENPGAFLSTDTGRLWDAQGFYNGNAEDALRRADWTYSASANTARQPYLDPLDPAGTAGMPWGADPNTAIPAEPRLTEVLLSGDRVAGDKEEGALLFSGISNLITTRSDVFTVHLQIRTFREDPETGVWDATDPDNIIDDSRYVMVVDRSGVDRPGQQPRILMMEKIED
ncbi:MAG: hypothetical protein MK074_05075 [Phycisphaerales bacterium]|nr:hypothetical protein [Phycisphaerales bacterium]